MHAETSSGVVRASSDSAHSHKMSRRHSDGVRLVRTASVSSAVHHGAGPGWRDVCQCGDDSAPAQTSAPSPVGDPAVPITSSRAPGTFAVPTATAAHSRRWFVVPGQAPSSSHTVNHGRGPSADAPSLDSTVSVAPDARTVTDRAPTSIAPARPGVRAM